MNILILTAVAYLLGALPFGLMVARARGVDIRSQGSGNIGATNVFRCVGKGWGIFTFILDALKGFVPAFLFPRLSDLNVELGILFGVAAMLGHTFPVYLKFKGGKGVATSAGMLLGVAPAAVGIGFSCWLVSMFISRYVSLSSIIAATAVAASVWMLDNQSLATRITLTCMCLLIIWLHRANIRRLLNGTESRFGKKKEHSI